MKHDIQWCGKIPYQKSLEKQNFFRTLAEQKLCLMGVEHDPVITIGIRGSRDDIVDSAYNIPIFQIKRGGKTTVHSPGQLVVYPIVPVRKLKLKIRQFISLTIDCTTQTLEKFGCKANFDAERKGFYADKGKIGFLGLRFIKGISMHGLSINVSNDLSLLAKIKSCGVRDEKFDRLHDYNTKITPKDVFETWANHFIGSLQNTTNYN